MQTKKLCILGSTGSVGESTLSVIQAHRERFQVFALSAYTNLDLLLSQCQIYKPTYVAVKAELVDQFRQMLSEAKLAIEVLADITGCIALVKHQEVDIVVSAIVGAVGLKPTLAALQSGKRVLIANKEPLVMAGDLLMQAAKDSGAELLPLDSEHNAVFQALPMNYQRANRYIKQITLTASGGPFLDTPLDELPYVKPEQACRHPNWSMGAKISVDSASMMNKGLELIEAMQLFNLELEQLKVVVHRESVVHTLVEFSDHAVLAQMSTPDMRIPIAHALAWPERITTEVPRLDLTQYQRLNFSALDRARFPCLGLAEKAAAMGGYAPVVLNAANEVAVAAFLVGKIAFTDIAKTVAHSLGTIDLFSSDANAQAIDCKDVHPDQQIEKILAVDQQVRNLINNRLDTTPLSKSL